MTLLKENCKSCKDGNCNECIDEDCYCREGHAKQELVKACKEKMTVEISYTKSSSDTSKRLIDIYLVDDPYFSGYCHLRDDKRTFRTDRINSIKLTDDKFEVQKELLHALKKNKFDESFNDGNGSYSTSINTNIKKPYSASKSTATKNQGCFSTFMMTIIALSLLIFLAVQHI